MADLARRKLCALDDIPNPGARGFDSEDVSGIFAVRKGRQLALYRNRCPHAGLPLNWAPNRFLDSARQYIICAAHGAMFEIHSGACVAGPCPGASLSPVEHDVIDGHIWLLEDGTG